MANSAFTPRQIITPVYEGRKNAIMNGDFDVWQRTTSLAGCVAGTAYKVADRWKTIEGSGAAVYTVARSTDVPTVAQAGRLINYSLHIDITTADVSVAAGDYLIVGQNIEGYHWRPFAQKNLTLSFWVKSTKTGTFCVSIGNSGADRKWISEYTVNTTNTWEKKVINIDASPSAGTWNYTNGIGVLVNFALMSGSTFHGTAGVWNTSNVLSTSNQVNACDSTANDFRLADVQLEVGDTATSFEEVPFEQKLAECQRYYEHSYAYGTFPGAATNVGAAWNYHVSGGGANANLLGEFKVQKRTTVTATWYSTGTGTAGSCYDYVGTADRTMTHWYSSDSRVMGYNTAAYTTYPHIAAHWVADAEL